MALDLYLLKQDNITFYVDGPGDVHLIGYYEPVT